MHRLQAFPEYLQVIMASGAPGRGTAERATLEFHIGEFARNGSRACALMADALDRGDLDAAVQMTYSAISAATDRAEQMRSAHLSPLRATIRQWAGWGVHYSSAMIAVSVAIIAFIDLADMGGVQHALWIVPFLLACVRPILERVSR